MGKRRTLIDRAIAAIDEKIAALQLAKVHLVEQAKAKAARQQQKLTERTNPDAASGR